MKTMYEVYVVRDYSAIEDDCEDMTKDISEETALIRKMAKGDYESGHPLGTDDYDEFALMLKEEGITANRELFDEYFEVFDNIREEDSCPYDDEEVEVEYSYELRKIELSDDTESGEETFSMCGSGSEETAYAFDTLDEALDFIGDDIGDTNIRMPGTEIKVVAINGVPVTESPDKYLAWTGEEIESIRDAGGNI